MVNTTLVGCPHWAVQMSLRVVYTPEMPGKGALQTGSHTGLAISVPCHCEPVPHWRGDLPEALGIPMVHFSRNDI